MIMEGGEGRESDRVRSEKRARGRGVRARVPFWRCFKETGECDIPSHRVSTGLEHSHITTPHVKQYSEQGCCF